MTTSHLVDWGLSEQRKDISFSIDGTLFEKSARRTNIQRELSSTLRGKWQRAQICHHQQER